jgi:hypothetical protein
MVDMSKPMAERMMGTYRGPWVLPDVPPLPHGITPVGCGEESLERIAMVARDSKVRRQCAFSLD